MGTRIPTVPYSTPSLESLQERDSLAGGHAPPTSNVANASRRALAKRRAPQTADVERAHAATAPLDSHSLLVATVASGAAVVLGATLGRSRGLRLVALTLGGIVVAALLFSRRTPAFARLLEQAKDEVKRAI